MKHQLLALLAAVCCCVAPGAASAQWNELAKLNAGDAATGDGFGSVVAIDGQTALIGAQKDDVGENGDQGSAYIFTGSGAMWTQSQQLTASDGAASDRFGVVANMDGNFALIGAYNAGAAYMFKNQGGTWTETQIFTQPGATLFGLYLALDGARAAVGGYDGPVNVYDYDGSTWGLTQSLTPATTGTAYGVAIDVQGDRMIVGAKYDNEIASKAGAAYVYDYDGSTWSQVAKLTANDGLANDYLGTSLSLDGNLAALGVPAVNDPSGDWAGAVYLFEDDGAGNWSQIAKLIGDDVDAGDYFGQSVLLQGDTLLVGAPYKENGGQLYTFQKVYGLWQQVGKTVSSDIAAADGFGGSFARDGDTLIVSASGDDDYGLLSGSAYVFDYVGVEPPPLPFPGDANNDKVVDELDAQVLADNWLATGANWGMGDFNNDQIVDDKDATIMASNWLKTAPPVSVPEPGCMVLLAAAALALLLLRRAGRRC